MQKNIAEFVAVEEQVSIHPKDHLPLSRGSFCGRVRLLSLLRIHWKGKDPQLSFH